VAEWRYNPPSVPDVSDQLRTPAELFPGEVSPVPVELEDEWASSRCGCFGEEICLLAMLGPVLRIDPIPGELFLLPTVFKVGGQSPETAKLGPTL
jgi:hypothetical protein